MGKGTDWAGYVEGLDEVRGAREYALTLQRIREAELLKQGVVPTATATVTIDGATKFVVADHFKIGATDTDGIKIVRILGDFQQYFGDLTEENIEDAMLNIFPYFSDDALPPIPAYLGERAKTNLIYLWNMLKKQPKGEPGTLLTNREGNVFYVPDARGKLQTVLAGWFDDGWEIVALPDNYPFWRQIKFHAFAH